MLKRVLVISLLVAPLVMALAARIERRLGASAAGWVAALPVSLSVTVVAVTLDPGGRQAARSLALSAASHVPAQLAFAVVASAVLARRGVLAGFAAGALAYLAGALVIAGVPAAVAVAAAVAGLALAPALIAAPRARAGARRHWSTAALTCATASLVVGASVLTSRLAGPVAAGAITAFPAVSTTLAVALAAHGGGPAGVNALAGLVRSLPCYLGFCLIVVLVEPQAGLPAVALAGVACLAIGRLTWRAVPVPQAVA